MSDNKPQKKHKISDFRPQRVNANRHTPRGLGALDQSIAEGGWIGSITTAADGECFDGSARLETVYTRFGEDVEPIVVESDGTRPVILKRTDIPNADDPRAKKLAILANRVAELDLSWDGDILAELNQEIDLSGLFTDTELNDLLEGLEGSIGGEPQEENEEEIADLIDNVDSIDSRVKRGEVWAIGDSALIMCGDCRDASDIHFLIRDEPINLVVTSPPYASQRKYDESSGFKPVHPNEYIDWFEPVQSSIKRHLAKDGSFFLNIKEHCEDGQRHLYVKKLTIAMVEAFGWKFVDELCWKRKAPPGKWDNRLRNDWEPVFHFSCGNPKVRHKSIAYQSDAIPVKGGGRNDHLGDHWNLSSQLESGLAIPGNVVECAGVEQGTGHTAAYPIGLPEFFIKAFSDESDRVFDPFMGSGTTAVAAVKNNRKALGTEISEQYCEIILRRLEKLTGKDAERIDVL